MTGNERILAALQRRTPDRVPTFEWFIDEAVGRALTGSTDPLDIVENLDIDGINVRADYARQQLDETTFVDEWGIKRRLTGDCLAAALACPIRDITRHDEFCFPDPVASHRFATLERAVKRFGDTRAVILNLRDGWSDMRDLLGYESCLMGIMTARDSFVELLNRVVDYNLTLAETAVRRLGVKVIATTDDIATPRGLLIRPEVYFDVLGPSFARIIRGYKALGAHCIKHCDGDVRSVMDFWIEAGIDCIDPVDPTAGLRMDDFHRAYGDRICLKGNIDCAGVLCTGTEQEVRQAVKSCIDQAGKAGLILSSSNTIHRGVRPENYCAMLAALKEYGTSDVTSR